MSQYSYKTFTHVKLNLAVLLFLEQGYSEIFLFMFLKLKSWNGEDYKSNTIKKMYVESKTFLKQSICKNFYF